MRPLSPLLGALPFAMACQPAATPVPPDPGPELATTTEAAAPAKAEMQVAERIVERIVALKGRHPRLRSLSTREHVSRAEDGRSIDLKFSRGVTYQPNPDCKPGLKCARLESFENDGAEVYVYLSLDPWQGAAAVPPYQIGGLHVVAFIDGPENDATERLRSDIWSIIDDERDRFAP